MVLKITLISILMTILIDSFIHQQHEQISLEEILRLRLAQIIHILIVEIYGRVNIGHLIGLHLLFDGLGLLDRDISHKLPQRYSFHHSHIFFVQIDSSDLRPDHELLRVHHLDKAQVSRQITLRPMNRSLILPLLIKFSQVRSNDLIQLLRAFKQFPHLRQLNRVFPSYQRLLHYTA